MSAIADIFVSQVGDAVTEGKVSSVALVCSDACLE